MRMQVPELPSKTEFLKGIQAFKDEERRDAMYKVATFLLQHFWGKPAEMADALGVLLLTWNQAFYRYGLFDFDLLEESIRNNLPVIEGFRRRDILSISDSDRTAVGQLFDDFLRALRIDSGKSQGKTSPVSVAKALHLLAPGFFPLWDARIARAYHCYYDWKPADRYWEFCRITKEMASSLQGYSDRTDKTIVKLIDEYNYARFTGKWI